MELPKNITQIGESDARCKVYVEDYVISYIKQMNQLAENKKAVIALYGVCKNENDISYVFFYGACRLVSIQKEIRHLSQAQNQEIEKLRKKYFPEYQFLGYRLLNGEMVEGFHICEQGTCRYISGYACFYEKNDAMLAYMLESRKEEAVPETVDQEKYERVKQKQQERRSQYRDSMTGGRREKTGFWSMNGISGALQPESESSRSISGEEQVQREAMQPEEDHQGILAERAESIREDRSGRAKRGSRAELSDAAEQSAAADRIGKAIRGSRAERSARTEQSDGADRIGKVIRGSRAERSARTNRSNRDRLHTAGNKSYKEKTSVTSPSLRRMRAAMVGMFLLLCVLGIVTWNGSGSMEDIQTAARQLIIEFTEQKLPDSDESAADSRTNTLVTEDKLTDAIIQENEGHQSEQSGQEPLTAEPEKQIASEQGEQEAQSQASENPESEANQAGQPQEPEESAEQQPSGSQEGQQGETGQEADSAAQAGQSSAAEEDQEPSVEASAPAVYVIKKGDTLTGISIRNYGTDEKVKEICELNHIEDPDDIRFGQKILLP